MSMFAQNTLKVSAAVALLLALALIAKNSQIDINVPMSKVAAASSISAYSKKASESSYRQNAQLGGIFVNPMGAPVASSD